MATNGMRPVHPGEVLRADYLEPLAISMIALARALHAPASTIEDVVLGRRAITADIAIRLARYFDTSAHFWMSLQSQYSQAAAYAEVGAEVECTIEPLRSVN